MASGLDFFIFNFEFVTSIVSKWDAPQLMNVPNASFWGGVGFFLKGFSSLKPWQHRFYFMFVTKTGGGVCSRAVL